jgi:leukotriene-A4 hydrolase
MHRAPAAMVTKTVEDPNIEIKTPRDPNTLSNYHNYVTKHTSVDFEIDFEKKRLVGKVELKMESLTDEEVDVVLDSRYVPIKYYLSECQRRDERRKREIFGQRSGKGTG